MGVRLQKQTNFYDWFEANIKVESQVLKVPDTTPSLYGT